MLVLHIMFMDGSRKTLALSVLLAPINLKGLHGTIDKTINNKLFCL